MVCEHCGIHDFRVHRGVLITTLAPPGTAWKPAASDEFYPVSVASCLRLAVSVASCMWHPVRYIALSILPVTSCLWRIVRKMKYISQACRKREYST